MPLYMALGLCRHLVFVVQECQVQSIGRGLESRHESRTIAFSSDKNSRPSLSEIQYYRTLSAHLMSVVVLNFKVHPRRFRS